MGNADKRGTKAQRIEQALKNKREGDPGVLHYCLVLDRSEKSREVIEYAKKSSDMVKARLSRDSFVMWEKTGFEYGVFEGQLNADGGRTAIAKDMDQLLNEALPAICEKIKEVDGVCSFLIGVDPKVADIVQKRVEELQVKIFGTPPLMGTGRKETDDKGSGLIDLAIAPTGRRINDDKLQIINQEAFAKVTDTIMKAFSISTADAKKKRSMMPIQPQSEAWEQDDGSLLYRVTLNNKVIGQFLLEKNEWREMNPSDAQEARMKYEDALKNNPEMQKLLGTLTRVMVDTSDQLMDRSEELKAMSGDVRSIILVFEKSPESLAKLKEIMRDMSLKISGDVDEWLSGEGQYLCISTAPGSSLTRAVSDENELLGASLEEMARQQKGLVGASIILPIVSERSLYERLNERWVALGGLQYETRIGGFSSPRAKGNA